MLAYYLHFVMNGKLWPIRRVPRPRESGSFAFESAQLRSVTMELFEIRACVDRTERTASHRFGMWCTVRLAIFSAHICCEPTTGFALHDIIYADSDASHTRAQIHVQWRSCGCTSLRHTHAHTSHAIYRA